MARKGQMPGTNLPSIFSARSEDPDTTTEKLACCRRAKGLLREAVAAIEEHFPADMALIVTAGALRSASEVERLAQKVQREAAR